MTFEDYRKSIINNWEKYEYPTRIISKHDFFVGINNYGHKWTIKKDSILSKETLEKYIEYSEKNNLQNKEWIEALLENLEKIDIDDSLEYYIIKQDIALFNATLSDILEIYYLKYIENNITCNRLAPYYSDYIKHKQGNNIIRR